MALLRSLHVEETCHLMANGNEHDGHELRLEWGVDALLDEHFGAVLICPPKPVAVYKSEEPGQPVLLRVDAA